MWHKNIAGRFFRLVTKHAYDDSQDRASIAASRSKNVESLGVARPKAAKMRHRAKEPQEGQHPLTVQRAVNFRLLANK